MFIKFKNFSVFILLTLVFAAGLPPVFAQTAAQASFEKIQLMVPNGDKVREESVRLRFLEDALQIETMSGGKTLKTFKYADIKTAEYSYSKNPRWKTGLGLGAAAFLFPPLFLVAIPLGFTKHRRHWLTFQSENDYAVLKLSKSNRRLVIPAFETKTGVRVAANGESK